MELEPVRFVCVMPSDDFADATSKRFIINRLASEFGYKAIFPAYDKTKLDFSLIETKESFRRSDFVFVDLSDERPSCYFELGIAESVGAKIIVVAKGGTPIHQTSYREVVDFFDSLEVFEAVVRDRFQEIS